MTAIVLVGQRRDQVCSAGVDLLAVLLWTSVEAGAQPADKRAGECEKGARRYVACTPATAWLIYDLDDKALRESITWHAEVGISSLHVCVCISVCQPASLSLALCRCARSAHYLVAS